MANHEPQYRSSSKLRFPEWQKPYFEAVLEFDPQLLHEKVLDAEAAIYRRLQQLIDTANSHEERVAINDAILTSADAEAPQIVVAQDQDEQTSARKIITKVQPQYPALAHAAHISGTVLLGPESEPP
jgi:hypothetical protein